MFGIGATEFAIILFVAFLIFGPEKIPKIAKTIGKGIAQFKSASAEATKKIKEDVVDPVQEAVKPYEEEFEDALKPYKEDLDVIQDAAKDLQKNAKDLGNDVKDSFKNIKDPLGVDDDIKAINENLTDPLGLKSEFEEAKKLVKDPLGIKESAKQAKEMFTDPLGLKNTKEENVVAAAGTVGGTVVATAKATSDNVEVKKLPEDVPVKKVSMAESLYNLDKNSDASAGSSDNKKSNEDS
ncbi:MAG: twin-arginine translocase TatA/TatE family subunit [Coriobacteriales bacterium]|nr:twin-arginine translocase TatA/TatE family subunit [Coriobacteriales bacterium]